MKAKMYHGRSPPMVMTACTIFNIFRLFAGIIYSVSSLAGDKHLAYSIRGGEKMVLMDAHCERLPELSVRDYTEVSVRGASLFS